MSEIIGNVCVCVHACAFNPAKITTKCINERKPSLRYALSALRSLYMAWAFDSVLFSNFLFAMIFRSFFLFVSFFLLGLIICFVPFLYFLCFHFLCIFALEQEHIDRAIWRFSWGSQPRFLFFNNLILPFAVMSVNRNTEFSLIIQLSNVAYVWLGQSKAHQTTREHISSAFCSNTGNIKSSFIRYFVTSPMYDRRIVIVIFTVRA